jgi:predicted DNA binding protein
MTVIGDFAFPGEHFVLQRTIDTPEIDLDIEIERLVAHVDEGLAPYFRITAEDFESIEQALADDPTVSELTQLETVANERFYRAHWKGGSHGLRTVLQETKGAVLSATFDEGHWEVRLLFSDREDMSNFFDQCRDELDFDIELLRAFDRSNPATYGEYGLSQEQRDALLVALEAGYYEVPRQAQTKDVAEELDISPQAVSQRLRRGYGSLITNTIGTHETWKED